MPGQRHSAGPRGRDSWLPRLAGIGVVVVVAVAGVTAYLLAVHPRQHHHADSLPTRVVSYQTAGLVVQASGPGTSAGQLLQLLGTDGGAEFTQLGIAQQQAGSPQWTADLMAGGTYIFIYLKNAQCLTAVGPAGNPKLELRHCNLQAQQRWRRPAAVSATIAGHQFYTYANVADGTCLTQSGPQGSQGYGAGLAPCRPADPAQLIAFWWSSV
jgi:hypothetical protein